MSAPRYDLMQHPGFGHAPDPSTAASNESIFRGMREWCAKKNEGGHRKVAGTSTCIDCGQDLGR